MAAGDAAAAAGLSVVPPTADARVGYEDINRRGDELAEHMTAGTHTWAQVRERPTAFPAASHTHQIADIFTGTTPYAQALQAQFDGKAPAAHTHTFITSEAASVVATGSRIASGAIRATDVGGLSSRVAVYVAGDGTLGYNVSSEKFKENIRAYEPDVAALRAIGPVLFDHIDGYRGDVGFIAETFHDAGLREFVVYSPTEDLQTDTSRRDLVLTLNYDRLTAALWAWALTESDRLDALDARITTLEETPDAPGQ